MIGLILVSIVGLIFLIKVILFLVKYTFKRRQLSNFPQLPNYFLLGEMAYIKRKPLNHHFMDIIYEKAKKFIDKDKIFVSWIVTVPIVFSFNKEHAKLIFSKNDNDYLSKGSFLYDGIEDTAKKSLLTVDSKDDKWRIRRKYLSQPFHSGNLENFINIISSESKKLVNYLRKNSCNDLQATMKKTAIRTMTKLLFEYDLDNEIEDIHRLTNDTMESFVKKAFGIYTLSPFLYRFTSFFRHEAKLVVKMMDFKNRMLNSKMESSKQKMISKLGCDSNLHDKPSKSSNLTLIEILLKQLNSIQNKEWDLDIDEVKSQLDTFIVAGFDTVSVGLTFAFYNLCKYPQYQDQIYQEIIKVSDNNPNHEFTLVDIKKMVFLEAFINESLRVEPVVPVITRKFHKDVKLDEKYTIPANTEFAIFIGQLMNDPDNFDEPYLFKPERFLKDQKDSYFPHYYCPFSNGPRYCVAKRFSLFMLPMVIAELIRKFKVEFDKSFPQDQRLNLDKKWEIVLKPIHEIGVKFIERD